MIAERLGDTADEARHSEAAYAAFASVGDEHGMADALRERGKTAAKRGKSAQSAAVYAELASLAERIGDRWNGAIALNNLGDLALQSGDWAQVVDLCGRSSILRRDLGNEWGMALALCNVAVAELQLGRLASAAANIRVALETNMKLEAKTVVAVCLDTCALIGAERGNMRESALLVGASARLHEELGSIRESFEDELFEQTAESIRASLNEDAYADAVQQGREFTLEEAAACALATTGDSE